MTFFAHQVPLRHPHVVIGKITRLRRAQAELVHLLDAEARGALVYDKQANAPAGALALVGVGCRYDEVGYGTIADEYLIPGDDVVLAILSGPGLHGCGVRTRVGLGQAEGGDLPSLYRGNEISLFLRLAPMCVNGRGGQP